MMATSPPSLAKFVLDMIEVEIEMKEEGGGERRRETSNKKRYQVRCKPRGQKQETIKDEWRELSNHELSREEGTRSGEGEE
jgi:hypothetical protein